MRNREVHGFIAAACVVGSVAGATCGLSTVPVMSKPSVLPRIRLQAELPVEGSGSAHHIDAAGSFHFAWLEA